MFSNDCIGWWNITYCYAFYCWINNELLVYQRLMLPWELAPKSLKTSN